MPTLRSIACSLALGALCLVATPSFAAGGPPSVDAPIRLQGGSGRDAAVIIGNEAYTALPQATYASFDARSFQSLLLGGLALNKKRVTFVENARGQDILDAVRKGASRVKKGGTLWVYYSGHGATAGMGGQRFLLGVDAMPDAPEKGAASLDVLIGYVQKTAASRVIIVVDAGFGGVGRDGLDLVQGKRFETRPMENPTGNVVIMMADKGSRTLGSYADARHGLFTWLVVGGIRGWADGTLSGERDGRISVAELQHYVTWTGRQMGWPAQPTEETRPVYQDWVLAQGSLEKGPSADELKTLAEGDRKRRFAAAEDRLRAEAAAFWQQTVTMVQAGGDEGKRALTAFVEEYSMPVVKVEWAVFIPEVMDARRALAAYDNPAAVATTPAVGTTTPPDSGSKPPDSGSKPPDSGSKPPDSGQTVTPPTAAVALLTAAPPETCDDLTMMEGTALLGQLSDGQVSCLNNRLNTTRVQTTKNKISRLMLVQYEAKGDQASWEKQMRKHLEEIDRSDPNLCLRYAVHLHKKGLDFEEESIYWADYALENKQVWVGDEYVKRVYGLYRLRTEAASNLWQDAESRYKQIASSKDKEINKEAELESAGQASNEYRGMSKDFAREWLDYARASGQDYKVAMELCRSASGSDDFCKVK